MFSKLFIIINPLTLFLLFNIIYPKELSPYEKVMELDKIEYVNIGSSHGRDSLDYSNYNNSINLGFGSQRMYYGLKVLESVEPLLDSSSTVIIPVSIFSFCGSFDGPKQRYLGFLSREEIDISLGEEILDKHFPFLGINKTESLIYDQSDEVDFNNYGTEVANNHLLMAHECGIVDETIIEKLNKFIERNIETRIVLLIPPYHKTYWDEIVAEKVVLEAVYDVINKVLQEHPVDFIDYSVDSRFYNNKTYFRNSDHMNTIGALKFTRIVIDDLTITV